MHQQYRKDRCPLNDCLSAGLVYVRHHGQVQLNELQVALVTVHRSAISRRRPCQTLDVTDSSRILQAGSDIVLFEIVVIGQNFLVRHPGSQQFEDHSDWVPEPTNARCAVTDLSVNYNA